jgi:hypothetical protein
MEAAMTTAETQRKEEEESRREQIRKEEEERRREQIRNEERERTWQSFLLSQKAQEEKQSIPGYKKKLLDKKKKKEQEAERLMELSRGIEEERLRMRHPTLRDHAPGSTSYERNWRIIKQKEAKKAQDAQRDKEKKNKN